MNLQHNRCTPCFLHPCIDQQSRLCMLRWRSQTAPFRNFQEDNSAIAKHDGIRMLQEHAAAALPSTSYLALAPGFGARVVVVRPRRARLASSIRRGPSVRVVLASRALGAGNSRRGARPIIVRAGGALHASCTRRGPDAGAVRACRASRTSGEGGGSSVGVVGALGTQRAHSSTLATVRLTCNECRK